MTKFSRAFFPEMGVPAGQIDALVSANPWFADLLRLWVPAGEAPAASSVSATHLRLAVRDGYLNFYRDGQSVAKVEFGPKAGLWAEVHAKYLADVTDGRQAYHRVDDRGIIADADPVPYSSETGVAAWAKRANSYSGAEEQFVERVVAANPNVIDMEMGLPAVELPGGAAAVGFNGKRIRVAPRIDLVALEPAANGWRLVLWEAKLVDDGRLRCEGAEKMPEVVEQVKQYRLWLDHEGHEALVLEAYRSTCQVLVTLHGLVADKVNSNIAPLGEAIRAVAAGALLTLDRDVRLLIDARPGMTSKGDSFESNGHRAKLVNTGIPVQMVFDNSDLGLEPAA